MHAPSGRRTSRLLLALFLAPIFFLGTEIRADKNDKFIVYLRFKGNSGVYLNRAGELMEKGDYRNARANLDAAIREDEHNWPAYLDRAVVKAHEDQWQAALQDCNVACRLRPGFFRNFVVRAKINQHLGRDRESLADLNLVYSLHADDETDADALTARALLRATSRDARVRDPRAAVADAQHACRLNYWQKAYYIDNLARACAAAGDYGSAVRYEKQAIASGKLTPDELQQAQASLSDYAQQPQHR
jgi:tetratricopeptide (TPR) repeat protein